MAFSLKTWVDRLAEFPNRRRLEDTGITDTYDVVRDEGSVTTEGDKINAANMNSLESRIAAEFAEQSNALSVHTTDTDAHISAYIHTKSGTVHNLAGSGNNIEFLATAEISDGDTWTVNGVAVTATLQNGDPLPADMFKSSSWVTGVRLDGAKLGFKSAGGAVKYNMFCQPSEPTTKQGIWLKTAAVEAIKKIVFDTQPYNAGQWVSTGTIANMPTIRSSACCVTVGSEVLIFGGINAGTYLNTAIAYNPTTNTYRNLANMPGVRAHACCAYINGEVFIFGGGSTDGGDTNATTSVIAYNPTTNVYRTVASMAVSRASACCTVYGSEVFIFGGSNYTSGNLLSAIAYNPTTNTYRNLTNMTNAHKNACCATVGTDIYIFGSINSTLSDAYSTVNNTYHTLAPLSITRNFFCGVLSGIEVYLFSGSGTATSVAYNTSTNTYRNLANIPTIRVNACCALIGNKILVFGGDNLATTDGLAMTAKQYPDNPTAVMQYLPGDISHVASLLTSKLCDYLPSYFKDAMIFKDTNLLYPELWLGNGTVWTKIREAQ